MLSQGESSESASDSRSPDSEHSDNDNKDIGSHNSSIWYFEGTLTMDLPPDDWNDGEMPDQGDMLLHFRTDHFKTHPSLSHACTLHWIFRKRIGVEFSAAHSLLHSASTQRNGTSTTRQQRYLAFLAAIRVRRCHRRNVTLQGKSGS